VRQGPSLWCTSDVHRAAPAIEHTCTLCSADCGFRRFPGLCFRNPLARLVLPHIPVMQ